MAEIVSEHLGFPDSVLRNRRELKNNLYYQRTGSQAKRTKLRETLTRCLELAREEVQEQNIFLSLAYIPNSQTRDYLPENFDQSIKDFLNIFTHYHNIIRNPIWKKIDDTPEFSVQTDQSDINCSIFLQPILTQHYGTNIQVEEINLTLIHTLTDLLAGGLAATFADAKRVEAMEREDKHDNFKFNAFQKYIRDLCDVSDAPLREESGREKIFAGAPHSVSITPVHLGMPIDKLMHIPAFRDFVPLSDDERAFFDELDKNYKLVNNAAISPEPWLDI